MLLAALAVFVVTLVLVVWQPRGLGIGWTALAGAAVALGLGVVHAGDVPTVVGIVWNATLTFVALVLISLLLDESGFFSWAALHVARWGRGRGRALFAAVVLLGAVVAALFANDGAALILTPIVVRIVLALRFPPAATLAFVMATGFVADSASVPLVVSNLVNIVTADHFGIGFTRYAAVMLPVGLVSVAASLAVLLLYFRRAIPRRYETEALPRPATAIEDPVVFRAGWIVLGLLLVGYLAADPLGVPLSAVAGAAAVALLAVAARRPAVLFRRSSSRGAAGTSPAGTDGPAGPGAAGRRIEVGRVVREAPWQIVLFSVGMYLVVYGLRNQGLTDELARLLGFFGEHGVLAAALGTGLVVAVLASVMNNLPTVLIAALAVSAVGASGPVHDAMVYASVIGADLGPKITPIGSLATLLWLHVLGRKGIHIGWGRYFRTGIVLTVPVLLVTLAALAGLLAAR
ncbi:arsenical efflux pump membrane protein ArsB [Streptomyces sp. NHF165]|uniref:arsenic transporter n=1 Tax=Streptomyces sp. NHF165 TaxID=2175864 RepID=UPI00132F2C4E|nr:arsenic transporter [Streptomyces sp. NHF165]QHF96857.1 arsenical efflux pump membrane protein ArsB [Streptomyces sp. NHF165]